MFKILLSPHLKQIQDSGSLLAMVISESWAHLSAVILWNVIITLAEVRLDYRVVYPVSKKNGAMPHGINPSMGSTLNDPVWNTGVRLVLT